MSEPGHASIAALPAVIGRADDTTSSVSAPGLGARIRALVAATPDGIVRSYRAGGDHATRSYHALWQRAGEIAAALAQAGAAPGMPVVILTDDILDFVPAFWACLRAGLVATPLMGVARDAMHRRDGAFTQLLALLGAPRILADAVFADLAEGIAGASAAVVVPLAAIGAADEWIDSDPTCGPACLLATSGSTGTARLVALSDGALISRYLDGARWPGRVIPPALGIFPPDSVSNHAIYLRAASWTQIRPEDLAARPAVILDAVEEFGIASINMPSSTMDRIVADDARAGKRRRLGSLTRVGLGSEPATPRSLRAFAALLRRHGATACTVQVGYGSTETGPLVTGSADVMTHAPHGPIALGRPRAGVRMRIVDDGGAVLGDGAVGELEVSCPHNLFSGYFGDPAQSRAGFTADGWWRTGDLGCLRNGELTLRGRSKEILIVQGRKFSLAEIDEELQPVLADGEAAASCVVAGADDGAERLGIAFHSAAPDPSRHAVLAAALRAAVARRFGLGVGAIRLVETMPLTRNGKLRRGELASVLMHDAAAPAAATTPSVPPADRAATVTALWRNVLAIEGPADPDADFFALGGDSLRALTLYLQIADALDVRIESDAFFEHPTLRALIGLVEGGAAAHSGTADSDAPWPLPRDLRQRLLAPLETWPGPRPTPSRLVVGHHTGGTQPPIFWVLNTAPEPAQLAAVLGDDQPLYAFRSGAEISDQSEDDIQAFALRYISEIARICPDGPFFIGGHCQGAPIALAMAQHALRRKRHVPLLILMDWSLELQAYAGRVLIVAGRHDRRRNARRRFARPELAWRRGFGDVEMVELDGSHALDDVSLTALGAVLTARMRAARTAATALLADDVTRGATLAAAAVPRRMRPAARARFVVSLRNDSGQDWLATEASGLTLGVRWTDADGAVVGEDSAAAPLPALAAGGEVKLRLTATVPPARGDYRLHIDLCDQGHRWFNADPRMACTVPMRVERRLPSWAPLRRLRALLHPERTRGPYRFDLGAATLTCLVAGWSSPEDWGTWSGARAKLRLPLAGLRGRWRARFTCKAFGRPGSWVTVQVSAGGAAAAVDWAMPANIVIQTEIDLDATGDDLILGFTLPQTLSPADLGESADRRQLGLGLIAVALERMR